MQAAAGHQAQRAVWHYDEFRSHAHVPFGVVLSRTCPYVTFVIELASNRAPRTHMYRHNRAPRYLSGAQPPGLLLYSTRHTCRLPLALPLATLAPSSTGARPVMRPDWPAYVRRLANDTSRSRRRTSHTYISTHSGVRLQQVTRRRRSRNSGAMSERELKAPKHRCNLYFVGGAAGAWAKVLTMRSLLADTRLTVYTACTLPSTTLQTAPTRST